MMKAVFMENYNHRSGDRKLLTDIILTYVYYLYYYIYIYYIYIYITIFIFILNLYYLYYYYYYLSCYSSLLSFSVFVLVVNLKLVYAIRERMTVFLIISIKLSPTFIKIIVPVFNCRF